MARHEYKAFVHGEMYEVEDHGNYITIRGDGGGKILNVHRDTAAELVTILEYFGMTALKNNDLSIEEVERMELNETEILDVLGKCADSFMEKSYFDAFNEDEKKTFRAMLGAYNVYAWSEIVETDTKKLDKMAVKE